MTQGTGKAAAPVLCGEAEVEAFLGLVGARVHAQRRLLGISRRALSDRSGVSPRYLAQIEGGRGNISIVLLKRISMALGCRLTELVADADGPESAFPVAQRVALVGLRGAGKSTLGAALAARLGRPFVELTDCIEDEAGMPANEIFSLYGDSGFRRLERLAVERLARENDSLVLAAAGGVVDDRQTFEALLARFECIWLQATPREHMTRVRGQGDERPMTGNPDAMADLERILASRVEHYARAQQKLDTSGRDEAECLEMLVGLVESRAR